MAVNKKITELATKIIDPDDIFIVANKDNNYQVTLAEISGALGAGGASTNPVGASTYAYFSDFQNNVGTVTIKEYDSSNNILQKVISDDFTNFKAFLNWDGPGAIDYRGTGYIEGIEIPISNVSETVVGSRNFVGFVNGLDVAANNPLQLVGEANGQTTTLALELAVDPPAADTVLIEAISQTSSTSAVELYPGDTVDVYAWFDFSNQPKSQEPYEFRIAPPSNSSATQGSLGADDLLVSTSFVQWNQPWLTTHPLDSSLSGIALQSTVNTVSDGTIEHGITIECRNRFGKISSKTSYGDDGAGNLVGGISTAHSAGVDKYYHSHLVGLPPEVEILSIEYPNTSPTNAPVSVHNQEAIKAGDVAYVENICTDFDNIEYTSPNGELTIENPTTYERFKKVTYLSGGYNINTNNFKITARKSTLSTIKQDCVKIANTALVLDIKNLTTKLRSSPLGYAYNFALQSDQMQLRVPDIGLDPAQDPQSTLSRISSSTGLSGNNFSISVKDADQKGTFVWSNIIALNLAGVETTTVKTGDENYIVEGFRSREVSASAFSSWKGLYSIGTTVTDPNNVTFYSDSIAGNLSFHDLGAGTTLTMINGDTTLAQYNGNPGDLDAKKFAIVTSDTGDENATTITVDPNGNFLYILDFGIRGMNNFGSATGDIEEN